MRQKANPEARSPGYMERGMGLHAVKSMNGVYDIFQDGQIKPTDTWEGGVFYRAGLGGPRWMLVGHGPSMLATSSLLVVYRQTKQRRKKSMTDSDSRVDTATNGREACTVVLSPYSDGTRGPLCLCFAEGKVTHAMAQDYNKRYKGKVLIISSKTESHLMTAETTLELSDRLYTPALRLTLSFHALSERPEAGGAI